MWNSAKVLDISCFWLRKRSGTIGTTGTLERLEPARFMPPCVVKSRSCLGPTRHVLVFVAFGATVDFSGYESRLHESCIDSGEICESCDARVHTPILGL
jgi:hypothetical protein